MRDIRATVEVRALIGAEKLHELHEDARERYQCWQCGRIGQATQPTSVIVLAYRVFRVVKLAHAACADPQIIDVGPAGMRTAAGQIAVQRREQAPEAERPLRRGETCPAEGCPA